jgi:hypothetical protein
MTTTVTTFEADTIPERAGRARLFHGFGGVSTITPNSSRRYKGSRSKRAGERPAGGGCEGTKMRRWLFALSRWAVVAAGLALAIWGPTAMWQGWETIQIERGWSLFIAGAVAISGGIVTLALGAVLSRLDHAIRVSERQAEQEAARESAAARENLVSRLRPAEEEAAVEVDRYISGGTVYVMYSDGSVELRGAGGSRRFASVAELRAQVGG